MRSEPHLYTARRIYQVFALIGILVTLLFVWTLTQTFDWMTLLFLIFAMLFAVYNLRWMLTRTELTPSGLTLYEPFNQPIHVDFRQIVAVYETGRITPGVSIVYYRLADNGLIDIDDPNTLFLPALENQQEFMRILRHEIPE
jgi:hypothetical protein